MKLAITEEELAEAFEYLDDLRASGETNMFGAVPHIMKDLGYAKPLASGIHLSWMTTYSLEPAENRAKAALT